jgi:hypothetical protein
VDERPFDADGSSAARLRPVLIMTAVKRAEPSLVIHAAYAKDRASIVDATEHIVAATSEVDAAATTPEGVVRPRDLAITDARARAVVDWRPSPALR